METTKDGLLFRLRPEEGRAQEADVAVVVMFCIPRFFLRVPNEKSKSEGPMT